MGRRRRWGDGSDGATEAMGRQRRWGETVAKFGVISKEYEVVRQGDLVIKRDWLNLKPATCNPTNKSTFLLIHNKIWLTFALHHKQQF